GHRQAGWRGTGDPPATTAPQTRHEPQRVTALESSWRLLFSGIRREAYFWTTHLPFRICTITRARESSPRWSVLLMLTAPLVTSRFFVFSRASRRARRNSTVPGTAVLCATGIALASSRHASQVYEPNEI